MTAKKPSKELKRRLISKAPPPPPKILGGGDPGIRSKRPDWIYWNKMPMLSLVECIKLLVNVDPDASYMDLSTKKRYDRVSRLVSSFQDVGKLPSDSSLSPYEFVRWARSVNEQVPNGWQPIEAHTHREEREANADRSSQKKTTSTSVPDPVESKIADDLYNRMSADPSISDIGGGAMIFNYLTEAKTLELGDGTTYFLRNEDPHEGQSKDVGDRKYAGVTICHTIDGKLQKFGIRKLIDAFTLRKKQEIPQ